MNLKTFLSVLLVYRSNFHVLHWMADGDKFFTIHSKAEEYCNMILEDVDVVAEMHLRLEDDVVNYAEALKLIEEDEHHEFLLVNSNKLYDIEEFRNQSIRMFKDILSCIEELLDSDVIKDSKNVGVKASLEGMHDKYDLQCRYLLRRLKD